MILLVEHKRKAPRRKAKGFFVILSNWKKITLYPRLTSWLRAYAGSCGSAIERSRERQRRARLPLVGIAFIHSSLTLFNSPLTISAN